MYSNVFSSEIRQQNRTEQNRTVDNSLLNTIYSVIKRPLCLNVKDYA